MREFWLKIFYTSGAKVYSLFINFLTLAVMARWLGPEGMGIIATVMTWIGLFNTFGNLSLGQVAIHRATELREHNWLPYTLGSLLFFDVLITIIGWLVAFIFYWLTGGGIYNGLSPSFLMIGFLILPLAIWEHYGSHLLMAVDRITIYNRAQITGKTVGLLLIMLAWWCHLGVVSALSSNLVAQIIVAITGLGYLVSRSGDTLRPDGKTLKALLTGGMKLHLNAIGTFLIMSTDILIINHYHGPTETGYYHLAIRLIGVMLIISNSASMLIYGKVTQLGPDKAWIFNRKVLLYITLGIIGLSGIAWFCAPWFIPLAAGDRFSPVIPVFQLLLLALVGMSFSAIMSPQWIGRGLFWHVSAMTMLAGIGNLIASILLVPRYGMYGAVWATLVTYTISVFVNGGMALWCELRFRRSSSSGKQQLIAPAPGASRG